MTGPIDRLDGGSAERRADRAPPGHEHGVVVATRRRDAAAAWRSGGAMAGRAADVAGPLLREHRAGPARVPARPGTRIHHLPSATIVQ